MHHPVIQEEKTGCGLAAVATIVHKSYAEVKAEANALGIFAADEALWSDTRHVRNLLAKAGYWTGEQYPFSSWQVLPDLALLSVKHHRIGDKYFWHWVVFERRRNEAVVLDSNPSLNSNLRTDLNQIQPTWFIEVHRDRKPSDL